MERCFLALRFIEERPWPNREVPLAQGVANKIA
jgi:hypothetical protein